MLAIKGGLVQHVQVEGVADLLVAPGVGEEGVFYLDHDVVLPLSLPFIYYLLHVVLYHQSFWLYTHSWLRSTDGNVDHGVVDSHLILHYLRFVQNLLQEERVLEYLRGLREVFGEGSDDVLHEVGLESIDELGLVGDRGVFGLHYQSLVDRVGSKRRQVTVLSELDRQTIQLEEG